MSPATLCSSGAAGSRAAAHKSRPLQRATPAARPLQRATPAARPSQRAARLQTLAAAAAGGRAAGSAAQLAERLAAAAELLAFARVSIDEGDSPLTSVDGERLSVSSITPAQLAAAVSLLHARATAASEAASGDSEDCGVEWDGFDQCAATALEEYEASEASPAGARPAAASQDARLAELLQALADSAPPAAAENAQRSASGAPLNASAPKPLSWPSSGSGGAQQDLSRLEASRRDL
jgi:hypothetical protein